MTDFLDRAQEREEEMRSDALARQRRALWPDQLASAEQCEICEQIIPEGRRVALPGVQTCIDCQADIERLKAQYGAVK